MRLLKALLQATRLLGHSGRSAPARSHGRWPGQGHIRGPDDPRRDCGPQLLETMLARLLPRIRR